MESEAEAAAMASMGGLEGGAHHPVQSGIACRNCGAKVEVRFCTSCGQLGADFHRPVWHLVSSSFGDMFAFDGRLWRTLPMLLLRPGRMTRDYIDGKRARFVPPFRMFLLTSVIFFLAVFWVLEHQPWLKEIKFAPDSMPTGELVLAGDTRIRLNGQENLAGLEAELAKPDLSPPRRAELEAAIARIQAAGPVTPMVFAPDGSIDREALRQSVIDSNPDMTPAELAAAQVAAERFANLYENQERFGTRMKEWAPRFTLLFLPIFSMLLALSYAWHRKRFFYDHLITGLHFQTFVYVLVTAVIGVSVLWPASAPFVGGLAPIGLYIYLMRMLRVTYDTGYIMAFLRTGFLLTAAIVVLSLLAVGLVILSFFLT
jgi:hypothetical protein